MHARRLDDPDKKATVPVRRPAQRTRRVAHPSASPAQTGTPESAHVPEPAGEAATTNLGALNRDEILAYYARTGYSLEHHAAHLIRRAHQRATAAFQEVLAGDELTPTQYAVLAVVLKHDAVSQNHLGRLTAMDPSTVSLVVRALVRRGFLQRRSSETDQRMALITLTPDGVRYAIERLDSSMEVARRLLKPLSAAEQATLLDLLRRVADGDEPATRP